MSVHPKHNSGEPQSTSNKNTFGPVVNVAPAQDRSALHDASTYNGVVFSFVKSNLAFWHDWAALHWTPVYPSEISGIFRYHVMCKDKDDYILICSVGVWNWVAVICTVYWALRQLCVASHDKMKPLNLELDDSDILFHIVYSFFN